MSDRPMELVDPYTIEDGDRIWHGGDWRRVVFTEPHGDRIAMDLEGFGSVVFDRHDELVRLTSAAVAAAGLTPS